MTTVERPCDETIRRALRRILESKAFARSERLRAFLAYVVEKEMAGEGNQLKGYSIAIDVFDRPQAFNADSDPLVRVHAGKLRKLLKAFYEGDGADDEWRIAIPKGTYVPEYQRARIEEEHQAATSPRQPKLTKRRFAGHRPAWPPAPFSSPLSVLTVLPLLLFAPMPSQEMTLDIDAQAKLFNARHATERVLPSVQVETTGTESPDAKAFATALRLAAQRHKTLARATDGDTGRPVSRNSALSFTVKVTWYDAPAQGIRVTLSHDGENVPLRQDFITWKRLESEPDLLYESMSLASELFSLDGEIYEHARQEQIESPLMGCMAATQRYRKHLTRDAFQEAWSCQQKLSPLRGDEPLFILSSNSPLKVIGH
ncbi:hypothetical protein PWG15_11100 [Ensifer adhaerens]|uniref:hypothetical protein n=1 Tax=Ensifer adhaerens TaxID=106592 RepID=UPI0023A9EC80|nr:hypothetical protein [Ensifer adhaerens]WDZ75171.1 hypothetical protein PWG15_11100 [Ensifer adhaerens]